MRSLIAGMAVMIWAAVAAAQVPPLPPPPAGPSATDAEVILTGAAPSPVVPVGQQHNFGAQIQFGYPNGLRLQYAAFKTDQTSFLVEGFAGARDGLWGNEAVYGVGGRALFTLASNGVNNALLFGPGVGVAFWQAEKPSNPYGGWPYFYDYRRPETDRTFLTLDANISWLHDFTPALGWEIGLTIGARIGLTGQNEGGEKVSGHITGGTIGVFTGLRF